MGLRFSGANMDTLSETLRMKKRGALDGAKEILERAVVDAAKLQSELLDQAITTGGQQRVARGQGNTAGRNDTGEMISKISSDVTEGRSKVTGRWGWLDGNEGYFASQDFGTAKIPAAHSLLDSYTAIRERVVSELKDLAE